MIQDMMECIQAWQKLSDDDAYEFRLILNELIANGTVHGNKRLCDKTIKAKVEVIGQGTIGITIQDEGSGFDYRNFFSNAYPCDANLLSERGRGLKLIRAICDDIVFNQNGNEITICKSIQR
jgi:anti-sigma regulatory factor (Ser/Thr protein kinase)